MDPWYSDDESEINVRFGRNPVRYVSPPRRRPVSYLAQDRGSLVPDRTIITTRSRSRERRSPPSSVSSHHVVPPPPPPPQQQQQLAPQPIVINNHNNRHDSFDESDDEGRPVIVRGSRGRSRSHARSEAPVYVVQSNNREREYDYYPHSNSHRGRSRSSSASADRERDLEKSRRLWELEKMAEEFEAMKLKNQQDLEMVRYEKEATHTIELRDARERLRLIDEQKRLAKEQERLKREIELEKLADEKRKSEEKARHDKEVKAAIEKYKQDEAARAAKEKADAEQREKDFQKNLRDRLVASGLDEKDIAAIMKKERIKREERRELIKEEHTMVVSPLPPPPPPPPAPAQLTYTRIARRHIALEVLAYYQIEYMNDPHDPDYIIVKKWLPEEEQQVLFRTTRYYREGRLSLEPGQLLLESKPRTHKHRQHLGDDFEFVRKKSSGRSRSRSPSVVNTVAYLAGMRRV